MLRGRLPRLVLVVCALSALLAVTATARNADRPVRAAAERTDFHDTYNTVEVLSGSFAAPDGATRVQRATNFIAERPDDFKMTVPADELRLLKEETDELGYTHVRFQQRYEGIDVWSCQTIVHFADDETIYLVGGQTIPTPAISTTPAIAPEAAGSDAFSSLKDQYDVAGLQSDEELIIYPNEGDPKLAYLVTVTHENRGDVRWRVFVDAQSGDIIHKFNDIHSDGPDTGSGTGVLGGTHPLDIYLEGGQYKLIDATRNMYNPPVSNRDGVIITYDNFYNGGPVSTDPDGDKIWDDNVAQQAEVSGHVYARMTYDYFLNTFGLDSYDGNGSTIIVNVHDPLYTNNAYWNGQAINFADGDGVNYLPFSGSLDVVAHELAHGVTGNSAGLIYQFQSGALNESYSDVFGAMVDRDDWLLGETIRLASPGFIRSMQDPNLRGHPKHMSQYINYDIDTDNGGVHINSGIPNHCYYQAATISSKDAAEQIWFRTLMNYLTPSSGFYFWAAMTYQSAVDLYGIGSPEANAVTQALGNVGLSTLYALPQAVEAGAPIGGTLDNAVWVHNPGPEPATVTPIVPAFPGLSVFLDTGQPNPVPVGDSARYIVRLDASTLDSCDVGSTNDTVAFDVQYTSDSYQIKLPARFTVGYTAPGLAQDFFSTSCLSARGTNTTNMDILSRNGSDALYDASFLVGINDGTKIVYRDLFGYERMAPIDQITSPDGETRTFRYAAEDGRIQGTVTYTIPSDPDTCEFIIAEYTVRNDCQSPLPVLTGVFGDFDIDNSGQNRVFVSEADSMIYMENSGNSKATAFALLEGPLKNLRAVNNPAYVYPGYDDNTAYDRMNGTTNIEGTSLDDWSMQLTFEDTTLSQGEELTYKIAMLYSTSGSGGLAAILDKARGLLEPPGCCVGITGNIDGDPDDVIDIGDLTSLIGFIFLNAGEPDCIEEANIDGTGVVDIGDLTALISFIFLNGPTPAACP